MTTVWPHSSPSLTLRMRERKSGALPGGAGTMKRTGLVGHACPEPVEVDCAWALDMAAIEINTARMT